MTAWFPKIIFLVLLLVVHSQARFFLEPTIYEIDVEIVEFYKHWHAKKVEDIDDVINEEVKSTYIGDLHEKLMVRYGAKLMWRIDVFLCLCFSLLFTDLLFKLSFRIVSRCSARTSKPIIRCYA
ncbi:hypothetical protein F2Q70_00034181 [Brassica cretica]|uniref:Cathepsin propeptide inhibitor domain-containing protein n=1 Tax=Brassica cretica TaxID=69181 RepID=A0A8S9JSW4_BRACR|nr:hypothetical protein F2Q68_00029143 [Brassica cretica]KAF2584567.1 hypothetical protein F2Q70_00034181 [Brassica cretica]